MFVDHLFVFVFVVVVFVVRRVVHLLRVSPPEEAAHSFLPLGRAQRRRRENFLRRRRDFCSFSSKQAFLFFFVFKVFGLLSLSLAFFVSLLYAFFVFLFCFDEG